MLSCQSSGTATSGCSTVCNDIVKLDDVEIPDEASSVGERAVEGTDVLQDEATTQQIADFNKRSQKAFSTIVVVISSSQLYLVTSCDGPIAAWRALRNHFERDVLVNRLLLKKQYFRTEMTEGSSVEQHITTMKELADRLAAINAPISEEDQIVTLLGSLPSSYSALVTALEARDAITLSYAQQALMKGEYKAGGSAATGGGTWRALLGKQTEKGRKLHQKKVAMFLVWRNWSFLQK